MDRYKVMFGLDKILVCTIYVDACDEEDAREKATYFMLWTRPKWEYNSMRIRRC